MYPSVLQGDCPEQGQEQEGQNPVYTAASQQKQQAST
jgi:hypothetical protein